MNDTEFDTFMSQLDPGASIPPTPTLAEVEPAEPPNPLDLLDDLDAELEDTIADMNQENETILAPVSAALDQVQQKYAPLIYAIQSKRSALEQTIKADVLAYGRTKTGAVYTAVFSKGRATWNAKQLEGYAAAHPEIERFKTIGEPSVSIRKLGKEK